MRILESWLQKRIQAREKYEITFLLDRISVFRLNNGMKTNFSIGQAKRGFVVFALACFSVVALCTAIWSAEKWQASFDDICSKVDVSGTLSVSELTALIEELDKLVPEIQASSIPSKKIYLQRLKKCRAMFQFMIDTKKSSET
jgi:hypothetical protein